MLFFLFSTLIFCAPVWLHPQQHLAAAPLGDKGTNLWNLWWVYYALFEENQSPLWCPIIFYPWGCDLRYHTLSVTNGIMGAPVTAFFGPNVSYNALFLLSTFLTGFWAALWGRAFRLSMAGACLFGLLISLSPSRWQHLTHLNLFSTQWMFCAFWMLEKWLEGKGSDEKPQGQKQGLPLPSRPGWWATRTALLAHPTQALRVIYGRARHQRSTHPTTTTTKTGDTQRHPSYKWVNIVVFTIAAGMTFFTDWYYGLFLTLYTGLRILFYLFQSRHWRAALSVIGEIGFSGLMVGLALWGYFRPSVPLGGQTVFPDPVGIEYSIYWSLDALQLFMPDWLIATLGLTVERQTEFNIHPGIVWLGLGIWTWTGRKKNGSLTGQDAFLFVTLVTFAVLALGPVLKIAGRPPSVSGFMIFLPAFLFEFVPLLTTIRVFARFAFIAYSIVLLFAVIGLERRLSRSYRRRGWEWGILLILFLLETHWFLPPMLQYGEDDLVLANLKRPILEIPFTPSLLSGQHLYHQTKHQQPVYMVEISRLGTYKNRYLTAFPALGQLNEWVLGTENVSIPELCGKLQSIGVGQILFNSYPMEQIPGAQDKARLETLSSHCPGIGFMMVETVGSAKATSTE